MTENKKQLLTGAEVTLQACVDAGADIMYGYPITPSSEVFSGWIGRGLPYLQTEDEISAGFAVCGAVLGGQKAFTATAGPGHVLMQDGMSMAEGMRLPFVAIIGQRGGPSSGTVIYSQQEVILSCYGGNGEGMRLVYSPSNLNELYNLTIKAFNDVWKYRFPAIVLTDGYLLKMKGVVDLVRQPNQENVKSYPLVSPGQNVHLPSIYTLEEELYEKLNKDQQDFDKIRPQIESAEQYMVEDAEELFIAHGIVGASAKQAVDDLREQGKKVGLFRPISIRPFPKKQLSEVASRIKKITVIESSAGQLERLVRDDLDSQINIELNGWHYPGLGIEPEEIVKRYV
ncbi:MAG: thiamine pyrophosphate-binding protein [bacterium]